MSALATAEHRDTFACFGSRCTVIVAGGSDPAGGLAGARARLLGWHRQFSRFRRDSELSRLNADPRRTVAVTPLMRRVIEAGLEAARETGGLVDPTLATELSRAGYGHHFTGPGVEPARLRELAPPRAPARPCISARWRQVAVDRRAGTVSRPPGMCLDFGGIAKGVFADELAALLSGHDAFAVDCAGDVRVGGLAGKPRAVHVAGPLDNVTLHTFELSGGAAATSGIGQRSWLTPDGRAAHHLLDPATGQPAFTGVLQATALAPTASKAEWLSKAALLSGPANAARWLTDGGVIVREDGGVELVSES